MSRFKKLLISGFILFNLLAMIRIFLPLNTKFFKTVYRPVDSYLSFFSIYQDWMMFAPNPGRLNTYLFAEVEFLDGSKDVFHFPRQAEMTMMEKYLHGEKYRKLVSECLRRDDSSWAWNDAARFVLRKMKERNFGKIPLRVHLYREWDEIPAWDTEFRYHQASVKNYRTFKFYTYEVI